MLPPDDVIADLPSPFEDEPPSVRQDIADELADHLACAYRRELLKTADEETAQQRVLDRFGNPRRIAYQLWFQALWGRIMLNRFTRVWQGLKIVAGLVVLFLIFHMAEQQSALYNQLQFMTASYNTMQSQTQGNRMLLEQMLSRLPAPPMPDGDEGMMALGGGMGTFEGGDTMGPAGGMGMMPGTFTPAASPGNAVQQRPVLKVHLAISGDDKTPAAGCVVGVTDESGESLHPVISPSQNQSATQGFGSGPGPYGGMPAMGGFLGSNQPHSPLYDGGGRFLGHAMRNGKLGYYLTPEMHGDVQFMQSLTDQTGRPLAPGRYTVTVEFPDGRTGSHRFAVAPGEKAVVHEERMECPIEIPNAYVVFRAPVLAQELIDAGVRLRATLTQLPTRIDRTEWTTVTNSSTRIYFDDAGIPTRYRKPPKSAQPFERPTFNTEINISGLAMEERFLEMAAGDYRLELLWIRPLRKTLSNSDDPGHFYVFPVEDTAANRTVTIDSEMREMRLDISTDAIDKLRQYLAQEQPPGPVDPRQEDPAKP